MPHPHRRLISLRLFRAFGARKSLLHLHPKVRGRARDGPESGVVGVVPVFPRVDVRLLSLPREGVKMREKGPTSLQRENCSAGPTAQRCQVKEHDLVKIVPEYFSHRNP